MNDTGSSRFNQARIEWAIRMRYSPMPRLDMDWLAVHLNAFRIGDLRIIGKFWEILMERDPMLWANADKRASDLAALEWDIVSDGSADGDKHAQALTYLYKNLRVTAALEQDRIGGASQLLYDLCSAHSHYYSVHEMLLRVDNAAAREATFELRHTPIWFFEARRGYLAYLQSIMDLYGTPCLQGEWLTAVGAGLLRPLSMAYAMKMFSLRDWMLFNSRYATGWLEAISDATKGSPEAMEAIDAARTLANDGAVWHNSSVQLKFLATEANRGQAAFSPLVDYVDRLYAICYRGMDMATSSRPAPAGGSGGGDGKATGASVQGEESGILLLRDSAWANGVINERIDRPFIRNMFNQEPRAFFTAMPPVDDTSAEDLAAVGALVPLGMKISLADAYKRFRWKVPEDGEPCLAPSTSAGQAPAAPGNGTKANEGNEEEENPNPAPGPTPPPSLPSLPSVKNPADSPTMPAVVDDAAPISAGAQPDAMPGPDPGLPDPQVNNSAFWSKAGSLMSRFRKLITGSPQQVPQSAVAIANELSDVLRSAGVPPAATAESTAASGSAKAAPATSAAAPGTGALLQTAATDVAAGIQTDMDYAKQQVAALLQIDDPAHFHLHAGNLLGQWQQISVNTILAPAAAQPIADAGGTALAAGLSAEAKDQP